jgi:uncharacterized oligopeptide transporter (OPT) family protein
VLAVVVYFSLRIDWARIIGRWFPWALENNNDDEEEEDHKEDNNGGNNRHTKKRSS